jgi:hypothetical protein
VHLLAVGVAIVATETSPGGGSQRRGCHGQRGVIAASEAAEASWIWMTKMHATEGGNKQEDGCVFWQWGQLLR